MKTEKFNRSNVTELSDKIQEALADLGKEYGISITTGSGKFDDRKFSVQIDCRILSKSGEVIAPDYLHLVANKEMESVGVKLVGNVIGSMW